MRIESFGSIWGLLNPSKKIGVGNQPKKWPSKIPIKRAETALGNRGNRSYRPMRIKNFGSIWGLLYPPLLTSCPFLPPSPHPPLSISICRWWEILNHGDAFSTGLSASVRHWGAKFRRDEEKYPEEQKGSFKNFFMIHNYTLWLRSLLPKLRKGKKEKYRDN